MQLWSCMPNKVVVESQRVSIKFKVILYDFSNNQGFTGKGGEQEIVAVKRTILDEFPCFLFSLPEGIIAFSQNKKEKANQEELCTHYQSVPFDICKEHGPYQLENNAQKWSKSSERQN